MPYNVTYWVVTAPLSFSIKSCKRFTTAHLYRVVWSDIFVIERKICLNLQVKQALKTDATRQVQKFPK